MKEETLLSVHCLVFKLDHKRQEHAMVLFKKDTFITSISEAKNHTRTHTHV